MSEASRAAQSPAASRAGSWARTVAIGIDVLLVNLFVALLGLALTETSGGRVRVASTVFNSVECTPSEAVPGGLALPDGFEAASARRCTWSVLGIVHDWKLVVAEKPASGEGLDDVRQLTVPTDRTWRPVSAFYVDDLTLMMLALYMIFLELRFGGTFGKYLVAIQVRSRGGSPLTLLGAGKRNLVKLIVLLALSPDFVASSIADPSPAAIHVLNFKLSTSHDLAYLPGWLSDVLRLLALGFLVSVVVDTLRRRPLLHDRWAGTEVVGSIEPAP